MWGSRSQSRNPQRTYMHLHHRLPIACSKLIYSPGRHSCQGSTNASTMACQTFIPRCVQRTSFKPPALPARCIRVRSAASIPAPVAEQRQYRAGVVGEMLKFMGPAALIPLGDPLMALGDTVFVGQFAGTTELAAMGPANMLFSFSLYIFRSLQVATQSLVASHLNEDRSKAARFLGCGLGLAVVLGTIGACVLAVGSQPMILAAGVKDLTLAGLASDHLCIRALALPAVLITMVAQSGMLAQHDSVTPCVSTALMVATSLAANAVFVAWLGWGLKGAAFTTVGTQYLGAAALMWALHRRESQLKPDWALTRFDQLVVYLRTMAPLTAMFVSKNMCYLIAQGTAAGLATVALAAHQAAFTLWTLFTWAMGPVEHACMAYLPIATHRWQQQSTAQIVFAMGAASSLMAGLVLAGLLVLGPGLLVKDLSVQPFMALIAPQAAASLVLVGVDMAASAINIAMKDYYYVARSYVVTLLTTTAYFAACRHQGWGLAGVWWGMFIFFGMRCVQSVTRATWLLDLWPKGVQTQRPAVETVVEGSKGEQLSGGETDKAARSNNVLPFPPGQAGARQQQSQPQEQQAQQAAWEQDWHQESAGQGQDGGVLQPEHAHHERAEWLPSS